MVYGGLLSVCLHSIKTILLTPLLGYVRSNTNSHLYVNAVELTVRITSVINLDYYYRIQWQPSSSFPKHTQIHLPNEILFSEVTINITFITVISFKLGYPTPRFSPPNLHISPIRETLSISNFLMRWNDTILKVIFSLLNSKTVPTLTTQIDKCICIPEYLCTWHCVGVSGNDNNQIRESHHLELSWQHFVL